MSHLFIFGDKNMCMFWDCDDHKSFNMGCGMDFELENFNSFLPIVSAFWICSSCKGSNFGCCIQNLITNFFSKCHP